jgi:hypothetical protein
MKIFRRCVKVIAEARRVVVGIEDDFHCYKVEMSHDGERVTRAEGTALRTPYTTCPSAMARIKELEGKLISSAAMLGAGVDAHLQCTHAYEAAIVALAFSDCEGIHVFEIEVPDRIFSGANELTEGRASRSSFGSTILRLSENGQEILSWQIEGDEVNGSLLEEPKNLRRMNHWPEYQEGNVKQRAVFQMARRSAHVSLGRYGQPKSSSELRDVALGACWAFQPERIDRGVHVDDSSIDFTHQRELLLVDTLVIEK